MIPCSCFPYKSAEIDQLREPPANNPAHGQNAYVMQHQYFHDTTPN